jgi:hypothetical protein
VYLELKFSHITISVLGSGAKRTNYNGFGIKMLGLFIPVVGKTPILRVLKKALVQPQIIWKNCYLL